MNKKLPDLLLLLTAININRLNLDKSTRDLALYRDHLTALENETALNGDSDTLTYQRSVFERLREEEMVVMTERRYCLIGHKAFLRSQIFDLYLQTPCHVFNRMIKDVDLEQLTAA